MPFRLRQKFHVPCFSPVFAMQQIKTDENGTIVSKPLCSKDSKLPDAELFELENLIAAKIPLQQINSKLVGGSVIDLDKFGNSKQNNDVVSDKQTNDVVDNK